MCQRSLQETWRRKEDRLPRVQPLPQPFSREWFKTYLPHTGYVSNTGQNEGSTQPVTRGVRSIEKAPPFPPPKPEGNIPDRPASILLSPLLVQSIPGIGLVTRYTQGSTGWHLSRSHPFSTRPVIFKICYTEYVTADYRHYARPADIITT